MKLTLNCHLNFGSVATGLLDEIRLHSSKIYNMTLYELSEGRYLEQNQFYTLFKDHFRTGYLQTHTYIHAIKQAMKDMKSYMVLQKKYTENPSVNQKPGRPRFKHDPKLMEAAFLKTAIRVINNQLFLSVGKKMKSEKQIKAINVELPKEVCGLLSDKLIKMVRLTYDQDLKLYVAKIVYEVKEKNFKETGDIMAIDLGVKNLAAVTFMNKTEQYLMDGNVLKSKIATFNKSIQELYSKEMICTGSKHFKLTKKMKKQMKKRRDYIHAYIHTASKKIIDLAIKNDVKTIVVGDFKTIKLKNKAKYFVQIPHDRFIKQMAYKSKLAGIEFIKQNEAYTSIVSALDLESVSKSSANKSRRIKRGLFKSNSHLINADINGSLNIMRKYDDEKNIPRLVEQVMDKGFRENPIRVRIL